MTTGQRIKEARKKAGLTQAELAEKLGVSSSFIAQYENDLRNPKPDTLQRIATALDISVNRLLFSDNPSLFQRNEAIFLRDVLGSLSSLHHVDETIDEAISKINEAIILLNNDGINEAVKRVEELTEIPRYQATAPPESTPPARGGKDTVPPSDAPETPPEDE